MTLDEFVNNLDKNRVLYDAVEVEKLIREAWGRGSAEHFNFMMQPSHSCKNHMYTVGQQIVCIDDEDPRHGQLEKGKTYTVARLDGYHGMDCVRLEGLEDNRYLAHRFEPLAVQEEV